jgi:crotonobetainyl-CoA:carnitine CoA-transferase CaiB-like acyl-CoA transferase
MGLFEAQDGCFNLGASGEGNWKRLCDAILKPDWMKDEEFITEKLRIKNRARLNKELNNIFREESVQYWVNRLNEYGVPAGPVYSIPQVFDDPQVEHLGVVKTLKNPNDREFKFINQPMVLSRTPAEVVACAPEWGEHTNEVLKELGYNQEQIDDFYQHGVV